MLGTVEMSVFHSSMVEVDAKAATSCDSTLACARVHVQVRILEKLGLRDGMDEAFKEHMLLLGVFPMRRDSCVGIHVFCKTPWPVLVPVKTLS